MRAEQHVSVPRCGQLAVLTPAAHAVREFAVAQDARRDDLGLATIRNPGNVGSNGSLIRSGGGVGARNAGEGAGPLELKIEVTRDAPEKEPLAISTCCV